MSRPVKHLSCSHLLMNCSTERCVSCHHLLIKPISFYFLSPLNACVYLNLVCIYSALFFNGGLNACSFFIVFISNNKQTFAPQIHFSRFAFNYFQNLSFFLTLHHYIFFLVLFYFPLLGLSNALLSILSTACFCLILLFVLFFLVVLFFCHHHLACMSGRHWLSTGKPASWACQDSR